MRVAFLFGVVLLVAGPAIAAEIPVSETGKKFDRETVSIKVGDALIVTNADDGDHNLKVIGEDGDPQDLGVQKPGKTVKINFPDAGSFKIRCAITPDMRLKVVVN